MARRWVAVEEDDGNVCEPCDAIDGTTYRNREDAYADYPGGVGYRNCVGVQFGNSCRGKVQKRRSASNSGDSMRTDARILASLSELLAQRPAPRRPRASRESALTEVSRRQGDWFRITNLSTTEARIDLYSEIGMWGTTAADFVAQLNAVDAQKINVHINSEGGEVFDGIAIHTALATHKAHVTTYIDGLAASAASFIAMAGDLIVMARNATMMIHDASGMTWGNEADHLAQAGLLGKLSDNIADMYAMQAGGTVEAWRGLMRAETWYTGTEALAAGLIDEVRGEDPEDPPSNLLSTLFFAYASRADAPAPPEIPPAAEEETEGDPLHCTACDESHPSDEDCPSLIGITETTAFARDQNMAWLAASLKS